MVLIFSELFSIMYKRLKNKNIRKSLQDEKVKRNKLEQLHITSFFI